MAADDKSSLRIQTTSFPYYVDTSKPKKPSALSSNLSNSNTNADLRRVNSFSYPSNARAPTRGVFGSDSFLKNIESPHDLAGAGSVSGNRTASSRSGTAPIMPNLQRNGSQKKGINGRSRLMFLRHCFDKKSVHVSHQHQHQQRVLEVDQMVLEESRRSIEVFGSGAATVKGEEEVANSMERKLSMLTWDAIPKSQTQNSGNGDDDVASDASSDLFEIENISGPTVAADDDDDASSDYNNGAGKEERKGGKAGFWGAGAEKRWMLRKLMLTLKIQS